MTAVDASSAIETFFERPILNSPYERPSRHWELDEAGQPTHKIVDRRRHADFVTPIPKPKKRKRSAEQQVLIPEDGKGISTQAQQYDPTSIINETRALVEDWRSLPNPSQWQVTPETARLLQHWRHHKFSNLRPFFCQVEAAETIIWLTEVAPTAGKKAKGILEHLQNASNDANPELLRTALKLATGAGKTTVMAMLIAWQTINAVRHPQSRHFTRGFLVVTPGLTIKDRLRVLQPNDPDSLYIAAELVPPDLLEEIKKAKIVITNRHVFKLSERVGLSSGGRKLLQGRGAPLDTLETEGQMIQRVMPELMGMKNILVLNDEAHHCYREKPIPEEEDLKGDELARAKKNKEAARVWISGLEAVNRKLGVSRVIDLSATPFFLSGSGYVEGTLFPWTVTDFSLMDAIESGIVKLPRVPVADNIPGEEMPMFRVLWEHIGKKMPKKGRGKSGELDPLSLPPQLQTAIEALYGHYEQTFDLWREAGIRVPPCFIVVCQNTAISKLVYDYLSGFTKTNEDGTTTFTAGRHRLFWNYDEHGNPLARPNTLLIDSEQLESGEALDNNFRKLAADEIERFRREIVERTGDRHAADKLTDQDLLREVMNTVGKQGQLGESIRCVVSVAMLTEGWDARTVTHVLGVRAFGTQLLCEQVVGRALRRQSYDLNDEGLFNVEYADILGIPFDFTAKPVVAPPQKPRETIQVRAIRPERDHLEIRFPRVVGYRVELPRERLAAHFNDDSVLELTPDLVGATSTQNSGIIGAPVDLTLDHTADVRPSQVVYELTSHLVLSKWRDADGDPQLHLFGQLKRIARDWIDGYLVCKGGAYPAQLKFKMLADMAAERITAAIVRSYVGEKPITAVLDPYNPVGSTAHVNFTTSRTNRWETDPRRCHVNWVILDSDWEAELCRVVEKHPRVCAYVKNHNLGLEVPYRYGSDSRTYIPDYVVLVDDGRGDDDLLHLVVEIKGYRRQDAQEKKATMETYWVPAVNHAGAYGRWAFAEFTDVYEIEADFEQKVSQVFNEIVEGVAAGAAAARS
ncbi:MAG: DEAD/DEAH box helicase family protein [Thermoleophilia bacterium]|nr:DEAD/DEAH box helicase family protein [Thermoleophilia bacterium]